MSLHTCLCFVLCFFSEAFIMYFCRGFLKSDKLLGTVNVKLLPLETQCTSHDSYDVSDFFHFNY